MPELKLLSENDLYEASLNHIGKMLVLFESPWCQGCNAVSRMIESLSDEESKGCIWGKVDISISEGLAQRFGVFSLPTLIVLRYGKEAKRLTGKISKGKLLKAII